MKKYIIFICGFFVVFASFGQVDIGLQVSPSLSFNRVNETSDTADPSTRGVGAKLQAGVFADFFLTRSFYFSTGIFFVPKKVALQDTRTQSVQEIYHLQYLQFPAMLKAYTDEIALDTRIYIQSGFGGEVKINEKRDGSSYTYLGNFRTFDFSWILGAGLEYRLGYTTSIFGGFSYRRGLVNVISKPAQPFDGNLSLKADFISLDLGIKF